VSSQYEAFGIAELVCEEAVKRVFRELQENGVAEESAFESATTVYRLHHPEVSEWEARFRIAEWLG
tara:strand:- start:1190 stop:1387 length:198 start_codon:yes stop_codon:yes gene_type:complete